MNTRQRPDVTQPIEITAEMLAWGALAKARQEAKNCPVSVASALATSAYKPRTRSANITLPL